MWKLKKSTTKSRYKVGDVVMFTEPSFTIHGNSKEFTVVKIGRAHV